MIVPIHGLKYFLFDPVIMDQEILLVKEKENPHDDMAIAAYNQKGQKIGYVSAKSSYNKKVYLKMKQPDFIGKVWSIGKNQVLVEIDF